MREALSEVEARLDSHLSICRLVEFVKSDDETSRLLLRQGLRLIKLTNQNDNQLTTLLLWQGLRLNLPSASDNTFLIKITTK